MVAKLSKEKFYIYEYWRLDNNTCFYVGKGSGNRDIDFFKRSKQFIEIVNKTICCVHRVAENITEKESFKLERDIIERYVFDEGYGIQCRGHKCRSGEPYLTNKTWGGEGGSGYVFTSEQRKNLSKANKGRILSEITIERMRKSKLGHKTSEETKRKISESRKGKCRGADNCNFGKRHSEETRRKISEAGKGKIISQEARRKISEALKGEKSYRARKVLCITTGLIFNTLTEASEFYKCGCGHICSCCNGKRKTAGKHPQTGERLKWEYADDIDKNKDNKKQEKEVI